MSTLGDESDYWCILDWSQPVVVVDDEDAAGVDGDDSGDCGGINVVDELVGLYWCPRNL